MPCGKVLRQKGKPQQPPRDALLLIASHRQQEKARTPRRSIAKPVSAMLYPEKRSRYFENGAPTTCYRCGRRFEGSAIHEIETNRYFCCDACLEAGHSVLVGQLPKAS